MPISTEKKWYQEAGIKKPPLQIKILKHIGLEGQLSKRMAQVKTGSDYSDVSNAIDSLKAKERNMIRVSSPAILGRKDKRYYALTGKGLKAFIDENTLPSSSSEDFWKAILWYCLLNPTQTSLSEFESYCSYFEFKYLGHQVINSYLLQSQFFYKLVKNCLERNYHTLDNNKNNSSISQKVLECMAIRRRVTLQQLCKMTAESIENVKKVLDKHSIKVGYYNSYYPTDEEYGRDEQGENKSEGSKRPDLNHMLIVRKEDDHDDTSQDITTTTYELSLFGIMLVIALVRFHHIGIDKVRFRIFNRQTAVAAADKVRLFFEDISLQEYFDKIALNYPDKLPLIFGKWSLLKEELGSLFLYDNFDFLLYNRAFSVNMGNSIWVGGNKEFCDSLQALSDRSVEMLKVLFIQGRGVLESFHKKVLSEEDESKLLPVYIKLGKTEAILRYLNNESFQDGLGEKIKTLRNKINPHFKDRNWCIDDDEDEEDAITFIERVFSNELSFLFYINLNNNGFIPSRNYFQNNKANLQLKEIDLSNLNIADDVLFHGSPQQRLTRILQKDNDIQQHFCTWMKIVTNYQQETSQRMFEKLKMIDIGK